MPSLAVASTNCKPAGSWSSTVTFVAVSAPRFESVIVKVMVSPTLGVASLTTLVTARSAYWGVSVTLSVLLEGSGSYSRPETVAVFVTGCGMPGDVGAVTVAVTVSVAEPPAATVPTVQTPPA